jgi:hypothetical protein
MRCFPRTRKNHFNRLVIYYTQIIFKKIDL